MIDNVWIFVAQLCSVLVYIGIVFGLYRLLASQKDATIQAKDATIENLKTRLQETECKIPDVLVKQLDERLEVAKREIERLKDEKGKSSAEVGLLTQRQEVTSEIVVSLLDTIKVFQYLSEDENEYYRDFVIAVCGSIDVAVKTIYDTKNLIDLASKHGKIIDKVNYLNIADIPREKLITGVHSKLYNYAILETNTIVIENATLRELTQKHEKLLEDLNDHPA